MGYATYDFGLLSKC